jgi:glutaredoxin-like protein NrdH
MTIHPFPNSPVEITVFSKPGCPQCMTTARHLDRLGLPYRYRDVTEDDEAREIVQSLGYKALPVVTAGDMHWTGYRNERLKRLAEIHGVTGDISWLDEAAEGYLQDGVA